MFALFVELETKPETFQKTEGLLRSMVGAADAEPGVVFYVVNRPEDRPNTFLLYELYRTRADWEEHLRLPVIADALRQFDALLATPPRITFCAAAFVTGRR